MACSHLNNEYRWLMGALLGIAIRNKILGLLQRYRSTTNRNLLRGFCRPDAIRGTIRIWTIIFFPTSRNVHRRCIQSGCCIASSGLYWHRRFVAAFDILRSPHNLPLWNHQSHSHPCSDRPRVRDIYQPGRHLDSSSALLGVAVVLFSDFGTNHIFHHIRDISHSSSSKDSRTGAQHVQSSNHHLTSHRAVSCLGLGPACSGSCAC